MFCHTVNLLNTTSAEFRFHFSTWSKSIIDTYSIHRKYIIVNHLSSKRLSITSYVIVASRPAWLYLITKNSQKSMPFVKMNPVINGETKKIFWIFGTKPDACELSSIHADTSTVLCHPTPLCLVSLYPYGFLQSLRCRLLNCHSCQRFYHSRQLSTVNCQLFLLIGWSGHDLTVFLFHFVIFHDACFEISTNHESIDLSFI